MAERHETALDLYAIHARRINFDMMVDGTFPTVDGTPISTGAWDFTGVDFAAGAFATGVAAPALIPFTGIFPGPKTWINVGVPNTRFVLHERGVYIIHIQFLVAAGVGADVHLFLDMHFDGVAYQSSSTIIPGTMSLAAQSSSQTWVISFAADGDHFIEIFAKADNYPGYVGAAPTYGGFPTGEIVVHHMLAPPQ
jgi:hypothetical protein